MKQGIPVIQIGLIYWIQPWNNLLKPIRERHKKHSETMPGEGIYHIISLIRVSSEVSLYTCILKKWKK